MSLKKWLNEERLRPHTTSREEIDRHLAMAERDIKNASIEEVDADWRFNMAYTAALSLATIPLYLAGYQTSASKGGHHFITFAALPEIMGQEQKKRARYLDMCRSKRNSTTYDNLNLICDAEVEDLLDEIRDFRKDLLTWMQKYHPDRVPEI